MATLDHAPVVKTEMLIHSLVEEVFEALRNSGSPKEVEEEKHLRFERKMYGVSDDIHVKKSSDIR